MLAAACKRQHEPPAHTFVGRGTAEPCAISRPPPHWPPVLVPVQRAALAIATELLTALTCFAAGLVVVFGVPGVADLVRGATEALFGRPNLPAEQVKIALSLALTPAATLAAALLYRPIGRALDHDVPPAVSTPRPGPGLAAGLVVAHLAAAVVGSYLLGVLMTLLGAPVAEQPVVLELVAAGGPALASLTLSALVLAPIGEEWFFRGLLFARIARGAGPVAAYATSALLFAAFHGNLRGLVIYLWLGLVFAHALARTGRLSCAIAVHFGNNAITLLTLLSP